MWPASRPPSVTSGSKISAHPALPIGYLGEQNKKLVFFCAQLPATATYDFFVTVDEFV